MKYLAVLLFIHTIVTAIEKKIQKQEFVGNSLSTTFKTQEKWANGKK